MPVGATSFKEALRWCSEVFHALAAILKDELYPFATDYLLLEKGKILKRYTREALQSRIPEDLHRTQELEEAFKAIRKEDLGA